MSNQPGNLNLLATRLTNQATTAADDSQRVSEILSDDRVATVMGRVNTAGQLSEQQCRQLYQDDTTVQQILQGLDPAQQNALLARIGQLGTQLTETASIEAVKQATTQAQQQLAQPAVVKANEAITAMNEANSTGIRLAAKAASISGAMTTERSQAIQDYVTATSRIISDSESILKLNIQIAEIDTEINTILQKPRNEMNLLDKHSATEQLNKLRKTTENQRTAIYENMIAHFNGRGQGYNGAKEFTERDLVDLTIPDGLKEGKGQDLIDNMIAWLRGRGKQFYAIIPALRRIGADLDANEGIYWKPPTLNDDYSDVDPTYRAEYKEQSKQLWHILERLMKSDLKLDTTRLFTYGLNNQYEFQCRAEDGVSAYFALITQNRPQDATYRDQLIKIFEAAPGKFADGNCASVRSEKT